jgi:hypothetical protein
MHAWFLRYLGRPFLTHLLSSIPYTYRKEYTPRMLPTDIAIASLHRPSQRI